jgi:hypothetical protein
MQAHQVIAWSVLSGAVLFALWFSAVCTIRACVTGRQDELTNMERWLAMLPAPLVRWFSHPVPVGGGLATVEWNCLAQRHLESLRKASKANDAFFVLPWTLAIFVAVFGIAQLAVTMWAAAEANVWDLALSFGIACLYFVPMVSTHEVRDSRWRARAPFEWQFLAAALWLLETDSSQRSSRNETTKLNLYHLWQLEAIMLDRFRRSAAADAPSARIARDVWAGRMMPLLEGAAHLRLCPAGDLREESVRQWVNEATVSIMTEPQKGRWRRFSVLAKLRAPSTPSDLPLRQHYRPSYQRIVLSWTLLPGILALVLAWAASSFSDPQSPSAVITQVSQNPAAAMALLVSTLAMLAAVVQSIVSYRSFLRSHLGA